jgi:hypothetical protein
VKAFDFRLNQALRWREVQVNLQKSRLAAAAAVRAQVEAAITVHRKESLREQGLLLQGETGLALESYAGFRSQSQRVLEALEKRAAGARTAEAEEMIRLRDADRKARLLVQMHDRQRAAWQKDFDRETEAFAADAFLCRLQSRNVRARSSGG